MDGMFTYAARDAGDPENDPGLDPRPAAFADILAQGVQEPMDRTTPDLPSHAGWRDAFEEDAEPGEEATASDSDEEAPEEAEADEEAAERRGNVNEAALARSDDPVRMFLREMSGTDLLSREDEIALAQRIEAGRDAMLAGLCESPITMAQLRAWHDGLAAGEMPLREVVELEAMAADAAPAPEPEEGEEGEAAPHATLDEKMKPEVLAAFQAALEAHHALRALPIGSGERETQRVEMVAQFAALRLRPARLDALVAELRDMQKRLLAFDGRAVRLALATGSTATRCWPCGMAASRVSAGW